MTDADDIQASIHEESRRMVERSPRYIRKPLGVTSVNYNRDDLLAMSEEPL